MVANFTHLYSVSWVYGCKPEIGAWSFIWIFPFPRSKKACQFQSKTIVLLVIFFDKKVFDDVYTLKYRTITAQYYLGFFHRLSDAGLCKQARMWITCQQHIYFDNRSAYSSKLLQYFLMKHRTVQVQQLPFSPNAAINDFFLIKQATFPH